jgi:hypothetical protein
LAKQAELSLPRLPGPSERKQITKKPAPSGTSLDDEIPF